jgi:hypothetical protein
VIYYERLLRDKRDRLGTYLLKRTAIFNLQWWLVIATLGVMIARKIMLNSKAKRLWQQAIDDEANER